MKHIIKLAILLLIYSLANPTKLAFNSNLLPVVHGCTSDADCGKYIYCCNIDVKISGITRQCRLECPSDKRVNKSKNWAGLSRDIIENYKNAKEN